MKLQIPKLRLAKFLINGDARFSAIISAVLRNQGVVAGGLTEGIISSLVFKSRPSYLRRIGDIDLFFPSQQHVDNFLKDISVYVSLPQITETKIQSNSLDYPAIFVTSYINIDFNLTKNGYGKIKRFIPTINTSPVRSNYVYNIIIPSIPVLDWINAFDFLCCQGIIYGETNTHFKLDITEDGYKSIATRRLMFNLNHTAIAPKKTFLLRLRKYLENKGYSVQTIEDFDLLYDKFLASEQDQFSYFFYLILNNDASKEVKEKVKTLQVLMGTDEEKLRL